LLRRRRPRDRSAGRGAGRGIGARRDRSRRGSDRGPRVAARSGLERSAGPGSRDGPLSQGRGRLPRRAAQRAPSRLAGRLVTGEGTVRREKASALLAVVVTIVVLAALGLGVATLGALETETARAGLASRQAAFAAEAGLRAVKGWFDAPAASAGAWMVPAAADVDRSRRRVDPEGDGTTAADAVAPPPWDRVYRPGRDG